VTRAIERAQKQVEARNFETRKHLLEYDDVMEKQRQAIYTLRTEQMSDIEAPRRFILETAEEILDWLLDTHCDPEKDPGDWETDELETQMAHFFGLQAKDLPVDLEEDGIGDIHDGLLNAIKARYEDKIERIGEVMTQFETWICLQVIDARWKEHLYALDRLKEGIGLRGYGQRDPLVEYKRESFDMYQEMHERIRGEVVRYAFQLEPMSEEERQAQLARQRAEAERTQRIAAAAGRDTASPVPTTVVREDKKVGRNDPCPCGSGKKYKKCCGR
jgi:preprotein translocase subunit SecA